MEFNYKFSGESSVQNTASSTSMSFAPDLLREPTFFNGLLGKHIPFREAISALHDIVVSDFRFKPKDKSDYKAWAQSQEGIWLAEFMKGAAGVKEQTDKLRMELNELRGEKERVMGPFNKAKQKYFNYLYQANRDAWFVLDPVITVHPDEVFFECFSQDESSYGKLSCNYNVFRQIDSFQCGTTNIDYSSLLYDEFQKIRDYKETRFSIDPSGFEVQTQREENYKEVKIDVPDTWVRGFLQVSSAMTMPSVSFVLHPMDMHNILFVLKRRKEKEGPRSIRFRLRPGEPVKLVFDPWNLELECPRSRYEGNVEREIRIWGRRRLVLLERLLPLVSGIRVVLLGSGMPSFYIADLGDMSFTLGLSGWSANDWSRAGNFDLLAPRAEADAMTMQKVFLGLKENWFEKPGDLARRLGLSETTVWGALQAFTQAGKVIYDLNAAVFRVRELSRDPLPMELLRFSNEREASASKLVRANAVTNISTEMRDGNTHLAGTVTDSGKSQNTTLVMDKDERLVSAGCTCWFYKNNHLRQGPCEHMLALRSAFKNRINN